MNDPATKALVVDGVDAQRVLRYRRISDSKLRRWGKFDHAFKEAVKERVQAFANAWLANPTDCSRYEPATFTITNEGRTYALEMTTTGCLSWKDGNVISLV
jgi:hypothetical protein